MSAVEMIKQHEGWRSRIYRDSEGVLTLGYGFNLEAIELPKPVGELWLSIIINEYEKELKENFDWYSKLDPVRQDVILDMYYNLGSSNFCEFKKMIQALEDQNYNEAAKEMLDSQWADQVGSRATNLASLMWENDNIGI